LLSATTSSQFSRGHTDPSSSNGLLVKLTNSTLSLLSTW
jgi:hypothetical protein